MVGLLIAPEVIKTTAQDAASQRMIASASSTVQYILPRLVPSQATRRHPVRPFPKRRRTLAPGTGHRTSSHGRFRIGPQPARREAQFRSDLGRLLRAEACKRACRGGPVKGRWQHAARDGWRPSRTHRQAGRDRSANPRSPRTDTCPCWPSRNRVPGQDGADGSYECLSG